jgi:hypothetical protein
MKVRTLLSRRRLLAGGVIAGGAAAASLPQLLRPSPALAANGLTTAQWVAPSGDTTGGTDTTNIQNLLNSGGSVWLAAGQFYVNATLAFKSDNTVLYGQGRRATRLMLTSTSSSFSPAVDMASYSFCEVRDLSIEAPSSWLGSSSQSNGIHMSGGIRCRVSNVYFLNLNGWAYVFDGSAGNCAGLIIEHLLADTCAGAISLTGNSGYRGSAVLIAPSGVNMGTSSGPAATLPLFSFTNFQDLTYFGHPATTPVNGGGSIVITGNCSSLFFYGNNMGGTTVQTSNQPAVLIQDGTAGSPQGIGFYGGVLQRGSIGAQVTGGSRQIFFDGVEFAQNSTHGLSIEGADSDGNSDTDNDTTGDTDTVIVISRCFFSGNGAGASGTNYDLNWSGAATGVVDTSFFASKIVSSGVGVQSSVNNTSTLVKYELNAFGNTSNNYTTSPPAHVTPAP